MNLAEQLELIKILKESYFLFKKKDIKGLRILSDHITEDSSIFQDDYSISLSIIIYTLSKILEKSTYQNYKKWDYFYKNSLNHLKNMFFSLEKSNFYEYSENMRQLLREVKMLDKKVPMYIEELISSSKIKKGGSLYGFGISLGRAADLLGISKWELMSYIGNTEVTNEKIKTIHVKERLVIAKKIFNLK